MYGITARGDISFILYRRKGTGVPRPVKHISSSGWKRIKKEVGINYRWHDTEIKIPFIQMFRAKQTTLKIICL